MKSYTLDINLVRNSKFRREKITANDLWLFDQFSIKDWSGRKFDPDDLLKYVECQAVTSPPQDQVGRALCAAK